MHFLFYTIERIIINSVIGRHRKHHWSMTLNSQLLSLIPPALEYIWRYTFFIHYESDVITGWTSIVGNIAFIQSTVFLGNVLNVQNRYHETVLLLGIEFHALACWKPSVRKKPSHRWCLPESTRNLTCQSHVWTFSCNNEVRLNENLKSLNIICSKN